MSQFTPLIEQKDRRTDAHKLMARLQRGKKGNRTQVKLENRKGRKREKTMTEGEGKGHRKKDAEEKWNGRENGNGKEE